MKAVAIIDNSFGGHHEAFLKQFAEALLTLQVKVVVFYPKPESLLNYIGNHQHLELVNYEEPIHFRKILSSKWEHAYSGLRHWRFLNNQLKQAEKKLNVKFHHVYFAMIDNFLQHYLHPILLDCIFQYHWSGLYLHPKHMRIYGGPYSNPPSPSDIDIAITSKYCKGIAVHDAGIIPYYQKRLTHKKIILFPETADTSAPEPNHSLAIQIKSKAGNRKIIGMIGLEWHKGAYTMYKLWKIANPQNYFFVFIGIRPDQGFSENELSDLQKFYAEEHENCYFYFNPLKEGTDYNSVFCTFDIPFIVYNNFTSTSNRLTKAAYFHKPVLASKNHCIGEDVLKYQLGEVVEDGNEIECLDKINLIAENYKQNFEIAYPNFKSYAKLNSIDQLQIKMKELIVDGI